ncbi:MAG: hypothetical protein JSW27_06255 [Phycisphaerales bacterium]|nr:MAG: hypothetical protein JSW27_06255 [Phycisphaerales bacterium]
MRIADAIRVQVACVMVLLAPCAARPIRVACVGDSNTFGQGLDPKDSYPAQLEGMLLQHNMRWEVRNFGRSGASVLRYSDLPYWTQAQYQQALACEPDVVVFGFTGNASRSPNRGYIEEHYVADYLSLVETFAALDSAPEIWICRPLPCFTSNWTLSPEIIRDEITPRVAQVAAERDFPLIDTRSPLEDARHLFQSDQVHPTAAGAQLLAEIVGAALLTVWRLPEFNGDSQVNIDDLVMLIDHWGQSTFAFDIAPPLFGDGIVDVQDLEILMDHWGRPVEDRTLIGHWKLDETQGAVATDSAGPNDGMLSGDPLWSPEAGIIGGALDCDGIDDCVTTPFVLNPAGGVLSVLAWVKGGAPGQVIVSQADGDDWLLADESDGKLMTALAPARSRAPRLVSEVVVTDGNWHRVAFVLDDATRSLYLDGVLVAQDTQTNLTEAEGGLTIAAGATLAPETFFSGLIDDVRVYNRAVRP